MNHSKLYPQQQRSIGNIATASTAKLLVRSIFTIGVCAGFTIPASAQITAGGDNTQVNPSTTNPNTIDITNGTPSPSGTNLFHSFGTFNLTSPNPAIPQVANFVKPNGSVQNILGRINGGSPSTIDGKIQITDPLGNSATANLYLLNPAGIVFGKNASLDINGAFTATTAKAIRFGNGEWFNALSGTNYPAIDPTKPIDFAFTDTPGSIFNAANLTTKTGQSITLVGGTVISTGDIKTNGGNISIATAPGGKYVQIKADGSILSLDLPIADKDRINASNPTFVAPLLPALLTGRIDSTATGIKIEGDVVKLVGDTRSISAGDIVTKNLDTSGDIIGGNLSLSTQTGNIITSNINTKSVGQSEFDKSKFYPHRGGKVFLKTQSGDIFVGSIDTSGNNTSGGGSKGGDVAIDAGGLFRAIGSINTGGNGVRVNDISSANNGVIEDLPFTLGSINITHQGTSFVFGAKVNINPQSGGGNTITLTKDFKFPEGASGTGGAIFSRNTNGNLQVVFNDKGFQSSTGFSPGFQITAKPPLITTGTPTTPTGTPTSGQTETPAGEGTATQTGGKTGTQVANKPSNTETQAANQKSKQDCTPNSTSVAANPTSDRTRAAGTSSAAADPCQTITGSASSILQILNNRN